MSWAAIEQIIHSVSQKKKNRRIKSAVINN